MLHAKRKMNESDVREDIAMPFLHALGYATGTANDIVREKTLEYESLFLGRKKKTDPALRGRADYILTVLGAGSWTLEIKAETVEIDRDAIEQAISYARHPQVAGHYAAVLNGRRFVVYHNSQSSTDVPLVDLPVTSSIELANTIQNVLSPIAIRQDCSPPKVDLNLPLARGYRSSATVSKGSIAYDKFIWRSNTVLPREASDSLDEGCRRMSGLRVNAIGGKISRDDQSRLKVQLEWAFPHDQLMDFAIQKQISQMEYVSLSSTISHDKESPTVLHVVGKIRIDVRDALFDIATWKTTISGLDATMAYSGQATGFLDENVFRGTAEARYEMGFPSIPHLRIVQTGTGIFEFTILR